MVTKTQERFIVGALVGGFVAAATALFLTPGARAEIRQQIKSGLDHFNRKTARAVTPRAIVTTPRVRTRPTAVKKAKKATTSRSSHASTSSHSHATNSHANGAHKSHAVAARRGG